MLGEVRNFTAFFLSTKRRQRRSEVAVCF